MSIFFVGDKVRTPDGSEGTIENFTYDIPALQRGLPGDTAYVNTGARIIPVPVAELEAVA